MKEKPMRLFIKMITICFLGLIILAPNIALSHSSHGVWLNEERAITKASTEVKRIVELSLPIEGEKLDSSWTTVLDKKVFKKSRFFIVSFYHPEKQKTLYVLLEITGEYLTANFNGNFAGL